MTIALIANSSWNIHNFRRSLIARLQTEGHQILLAAPLDAYSERVKEIPGVRFISLKHLQARRKNLLSDLLCLKELYTLYRNERPDLILHFTIKPNIYGSFAAARAGIDSIAVVTGLGYTFVNESFSHRLVRRLYYFAFHRSAKVVFQNPDDQQLFHRLGLVNPAKSLLIPGSGVDVQYFHPGGSNQADEPFIFLFIGRLLLDKGIREFYEAARLLKNDRFVFWVVGELQPDHPNGLSEKLFNRWLESGVIQYLGHREDVRPLLSKAHVFVLPSYREGLPRSILEATSMAKPIITTDVPGCRETVVEGENGFLVPVKTVEPLAQAMAKMSRINPELRQKMGARSREIVVQKFSQEVVNERFAKLINSIICHPNRKLIQRF